MSPKQLCGTKLLNESRGNVMFRRFYRIDGVKPLSLNAAYATMQGKNRNPNPKFKWKNKIWRRKTDEALLYQWEIQETLAWMDFIKYGPKILIPKANNYQGIALTLVFFIPPRELRVVDGSKFKGRDVSNYVKLIEDAVFEYLCRTDGLTYPQEKAKIEDSSSIEPLSFKRLSWDNDWHIHIFLSPDVTALTDSPVYHAGDTIRVRIYGEHDVTGNGPTDSSAVRQLPGPGPLPDGEQPVLRLPAASRVDRLAN
jgi:hypothetical protein